MIPNDDGEFLEFYEATVWDVYAFLSFRCRSRHEAEDLTQEVYERALKAWARFDPARGSARAWVMLIARNAYIDARRRASARPEDPSGAEVDDLELSGSEDVGYKHGPDPELALALSRLKRREREAIALRFGGDLTTAEVALVLGVSVANAQQILSRALRQLRSTFRRAGLERQI